MTVMSLPKYIRTHYRTSNNVERINRELKRRSDVIGVFPNEESIIRLMGSILIDLNDKEQKKKKKIGKETLKIIQSEQTIKNLQKSLWNSSCSSSPENINNI